MTASSSTALTGRVALVTGGSGGIGAATARLLAAHGAAVAVSYRRNATAADAVVDSIAAAGGKAVAVGGDVTDPADVDRMADETTAALGAPDILVLSAAGISSFEFGPQQIRVNAVSPGYVRTEANAGMVPAQVREQIAGDTPLRRTAEPDDVAAAALSLVAGSGFVTGATVPVDGGMVL